MHLCHSPSQPFNSWNAGGERNAICLRRNPDLVLHPVLHLVLIPFQLQERDAILQWRGGEVFVISRDDSLGAANLTGLILLLWRKVHYNFHKKRFERGQSTEMETILQSGSALFHVFNFLLHRPGTYLKGETIWFWGWSSELAEGNAFFLLICHMFPISYLTILDFCFFGELAMVRPEESPLQILTYGLVQPQEVRCLSISSVCKSARGPAALVRTSWAAFSDSCGGLS